MACLGTSAESLSSCLEKAEEDLKSISRQFEEEFHHRFSDSQVLAKPSVINVNEGRAPQQVQLLTGSFYICSNY